MDLRGKTVVMTGATSGIGASAAQSLARAGARILFTARNKRKGEETLALLLRANPDAAHDMVLADLTTLAEMTRAGETLAAKAREVHVLVNNAGAIFPTRELTADGLEISFAVNHMAYFVVTECLRPALAEGARIISTASMAHRSGRLDFSDMGLERVGPASYSMAAYGRSKLCNILWTRELARRLEGTGITANCLHPGGVNTGFGDNLEGPGKAAFGLIKRFMLSPAQGADTLVWLAQSDSVEGQSGGYYAKRRLVTPSARARDPEAQGRLWAFSESLIRPNDPAPPTRKRRAKA
ncbi:MAG: SDR family NAD(P)-dependent oxidoreductase [Alphaproteobacteria bacterium]|nr:SDR family NAD(P)-dependent oxidoreductase [Alphaproteobacteria bacterium]